MSKQIHSRTVAPKQIAEAPEVDEKNTRILKVAEKRNALITLADQIARNKTLVYKNHPIPGGHKEFPHDYKMRLVSLFYPLAEGGPLYIDEPMFKNEEASCVKKAAVMKKLNLRYCFICRDSTIEDVVAQLGE
jgi:hypothetical protein